MESALAKAGRVIADIGLNNADLNNLRMCITSSALQDDGDIN